MPGQGEPGQAALVDRPTGSLVPTLRCELGGTRAASVYLIISSDYTPRYALAAIRDGNEDF
jgi:hypothetical protein